MRCALTGVDIIKLQFGVEVRLPVAQELSFDGRALYGAEGIRKRRGKEAVREENHEQL